MLRVPYEGAQHRDLKCLEVIIRKRFMFIFQNPLWLFLETPIKGLSLDFPSSAPTTVKITIKPQDNRINWVIPKNLGNFAGNLEFRKISKITKDISTMRAQTNVKTTKIHQDNRINWVMPKIFGNLGLYSDISKFSRPTINFSPFTASTFLKTPTKEKNQNLLPQFFSNFLPPTKTSLTANPLLTNLATFFAKSSRIT